MLDSLARPFVAFVERCYPDPFVFAIVLTLFTFGAALGFTNTSAVESLALWGDGLSGLLSFTTQVCLTLVAAHALAHTGPVREIVRTFARLPRSPAAAYVTVVLVAGIASLVAWSFGLVAGALIAREVAQEGRRNGMTLHYPLLVAAAYGGFVVWHMGYSGSAPLFVATPGHAMEAAVGVIPVTETIFAIWNLAMIPLVLATVATLCVLFHPGDASRPLTLAEDEDEATASASTGNAVTWAERIDRNRGLSITLGGMLTAYLAAWFAREGFALDLNVVNWSFMAIGLLLSRSPVHYVALFSDACRAVGPVLLQYPLYAGIMALMAGTGLMVQLSDLFTTVATPHTLPLWAFVCGGIVNLFVASGGGQWAVQGPVFLAGR